MRPRRWVGPFLLIAIALASCGGDEDNLFEAPAATPGKDASVETGAGGYAGTGGTGNGGAAGQVPCPTTKPTFCGTECVDTSQDPEHCGGCSLSCGSGQSCLNGQCLSSGACAKPADCNDGFACTVDSCENGVCYHTAGPNSGATACPSGQTCVAGLGCVQSKVCANDDDCADSDACTVSEACDLVTSTCTWALLDKDQDGQAPLACGGTDCDDSNGHVYVGATEPCDGLDNDCNGVADNNAVCSSPWSTCQGGTCVCAPEHACGSDCVDKTTNPSHCGQCFQACLAGGVCTNGSCACPSGSSACGNTCTYLLTDPKNCGSCGHACANGASCNSGNCVCSGSQTVCQNTCVNTSTNNSHCGSCNHACGTLETCTGGQCKCSYTQCSGVCVNTQTDSQNCGNCGTVCSSSQCSGGVCGSGGSGSGAMPRVVPETEDGCRPDQISIFKSCFP